MFKATHMARAARQAAKSNGLSTVGSFEVLSQHTILNEDDNGFDTVVIRAYSPKGDKSVDITAGDIFYFKSVMQDAPMARIA